MMKMKIAAVTMMAAMAQITQTRMITTMSGFLVRALALMALSIAVLAGALSAEAGSQAAIKTNVAHARGRTDMDFVGNTAFATSRLRSLCATTIDSSDAATSAKIRDRVLAVYRDAGYLSASVESTCFVRKERSTRLVTYIREGRQGRVGKFKFSGNKHFSPDELAFASGLRETMVFTPGLLDASLERIVGYMADRGFAFASARIGDLNQKGDELGFTFIIDEGPLCTVGEVVLENSVGLRSSALKRALGMKSGGIYSEKDLRRGVESLRRTVFFTEVGEPLVSVSNENSTAIQGQSTERSVTIGLPVRDRKTTSIAGAVGFRGGTNEVTGGVSLALLNIAHTGRSATMSWEAAGRNVSSLYLSYAEPWVMGLPFTSSISFEQITRDTLFAHSALGIALKVPLTTYVSAQLGANFEKSVNTDGLRTRTSRLAWLGGIEFVSGAPGWSPENSFMVELDGTRGDKRIAYLSSGLNTKEVFSTLAGRLFLQRRIRNAQIALVDLKASAIMEGRERATPDELFALGGKRTLRGYSERQFLASTVGSAQIEYGLAVGREGGRAFVFVDYGYASTPAFSTGERFHVGYGVGLKVPSPIGIAGIDFGIPSGESLGAGKIHVGLEGTF